LAMSTWTIYLDERGGRMTVPDRKIVESILLLAGDPVPAGAIGEVLEKPKAEVEVLLSDLAADYESAERGFVLRETATGWRLYTHPDSAPWLERFVIGDRAVRLSGPALEVLAIIAYRGPIARSQIAELRGVDSDGVVRTLVHRGLVVDTARAQGQGGPSLLVVSDDFLEKMGLSSIEALPPLAGFMPDAEAIEAMEARLSPGA